MSAYVLKREHFVAIACFVARHCAHTATDRGLFVYHPDNRADGHRIPAVDVANHLLNANLMSVAYRYKEDPENVPAIRNDEVSALRSPDPLDLVGVLRSLEYQSCERDDYNESLGNAVLTRLLWAVATAAAEKAGADTWAG